MPLEEMKNSLGLVAQTKHIEETQIVRGVVDPRIEDQISQGTMP